VDRLALHIILGEEKDLLSYRACKPTLTNSL